MQILVTGGAGYIGSHAVLELIKRDVEVVILDSFEFGHMECVPSHEKVHVYKGNISDGLLLDEIFTSFKIDAVMHFAAYAYVGESVISPAKYYQNNVVNTLAMLGKMVEYDIKKIIFSSSCATYGVPKQLPILEDTPQNPVNPYGRTKLIVEQILEDYRIAYGIQSVILRYFNAAGADPECRSGEWHEPETHLIPLALQAAAGNGNALKIFGDDYPTKDGTCIRDYVHVSDLANAHFLGLQYMLHNNSSLELNLGNGCGFSVKEIIRCVEVVTGKTVPFEVAPRRIGDPPSLISSAEKAHLVLGWESKYGELEKIIGDAWDWYQRIHV